MVADDGFGGLRPDEGRRVLVPRIQERFDVSYECCLGGEIRSANGASSENAEEPFDLIHPGRALRREVKLDARVFGKPLPDFGCLVRRRVIEDNVESSSRKLAGELLQK